MKVQVTELTPELAAQLLANPHPRQRRQSRATVAAYARTIQDGRWQLVPDPILVAPDGRMFNGGHRCAAVVVAHHSIPVMISWDADPETFDLIDVGRRRSAYQFIDQSGATALASAARVTLWHEHRFGRPLGPQTMGWDLDELLAEVERRRDAFEAMLPAARQTYEFTSIPVSVALGAYALAWDRGHQEEVSEFAAALRDPTLPPSLPARLLVERFQRQANRSRRRTPGEDWTILVRALNLHLEKRTADRLQLGTVWPAVGETEAAYRRRSSAVSQARKYRIHRDEIKTRRSRS